MPQCNSTEAMNGGRWCPFGLYYNFISGGFCYSKGYFALARHALDTLWDWLLSKISVSVSFDSRLEAHLAIHISLSFSFYIYIYIYLYVDLCSDFSTREV